MTNRIDLIIIDPQNDFCYPGAEVAYPGLDLTGEAKDILDKVGLLNPGSLFVPGANEDMDKVANMIDEIGHKFFMLQWTATTISTLLILLHGLTPKASIRHLSPSLQLMMWTTRYGSVHFPKRDHTANGMFINSLITTGILFASGHLIASSEQLEMQSINL